MARRSNLAACILTVWALLIAGCGNPPSPVSGGVRLDFDRKDPRPFVEFYMSLLIPDGSDVYRSGLIVESDGTFFLDPAVLHERFRTELAEPASDGTLHWDELKPFFARHYYEQTDAPPTLSALLDQDVLSSEDGWLEMEVVGVMTTAARHILVPRSSVRAALESYSENGERLVYPTGTTIVADHTLDEEPVETTAMRKRPDGRWDFFVFDDGGLLDRETDTPPKSLMVPTQCTGCHLGSRLFEPEKSFPGPAPDGPDGPREVRIDPQLRNTMAAQFLEEHRKRSDGILGLYGTIYLSGLLSARDDGSIGPDDAKLLDELGL